MVSALRYVGTGYTTVSKTHLTELTVVCVCLCVWWGLQCRLNALLRREGPEHQGCVQHGWLKHLWQEGLSKGGGMA